jgi:hypothetical protein
VISLGFPRLPQYYSREVLTNAKVVAVDRVPMPPLSSMGLVQFAGFEQMEFAGITYVDTYFLRHEHMVLESIHFHELVHVIQWRILGPERFLAVYADGLGTHGYRNSPLEVMAYSLQERFDQGSAPFDVEALVKSQLRAI